MSTSTPTKSRARVGALEILVGLLVIALIFRWQFTELFASPAIQTGATLFVSIVVQALPFLVLGVALSGAIAAFVPASFWHKVLPKNPALAVPVAGAAGVVLPGCECASVPIAGGLMRKGVTPAAALAFLLSAPAINPIVIASTFVAFPGQPEVALARFVASLIAAVIMGWLWLKFGKGEWLRLPKRGVHETGSKWKSFRLTAGHDFLQAGGFLVVGALVAAILNVAVPRDIVDAVASNPWISVLALAILAVLLCMCSEADAFVAASFTSFSNTAKLAFMVVGPMVDIKLIAMQGGWFSRSFVLRFAPVTFVVAVLCAVAVGWWLL
ncbi:MAG: permease [Candidatus Nanopelagicales bacterium]